MQQLVERRDDIDHILIETSGLALPKPLVQAFNWPEIKLFFCRHALPFAAQRVSPLDDRHVLYLHRKGRNR